MSELKKRSTTQTIGAIAGAAVGAVVGKYSGINFLIPIGFALLVGWICSKTVLDSFKPFVVAFSIQAGHALWMLLGAFFMKSLAPVGLDLLLFAIGLTWLLLKPGTAAVIFLAIFQGLSTVINGYQFLSSQPDTTPNKALLVHLIFRISGIVFMFIGLSQVRKTNQLIENDQPA